MKKKVLVYPCGTEIALEIHRALCYSTHYTLIGGTDGYDHGMFVFHEIIGNLPYITDSSDETDIEEFERTISNYDIDFIYPAMDGVITVFAKFRHLFKESLIVPEGNTAELCRSKKATYKCLENVINTPIVYEKIDEVDSLPVFIKPDCGQGSVGAKLINSYEELQNVDFNKYVVMEYLPGKEYTIDCFTNLKGELIYCKARGRKRIKNGISVNAVFEDLPGVEGIARKINNSIKQKGGWFFQVRESQNGTLKLLEVACRIAGTSSISRNIGANLPLMTLDVFNGIAIDDVSLNTYMIELDRALENVYKTNISYSSVYIDYDDTIVKDGVINTMVVKFLYQCVNKNVRIILLSKHDGNLYDELKKYKLSEIFDEVIHIERSENKKDYIRDLNCIFIDDSYGERRAVRKAFNVPVFDTHMMECLMED